MTIATFELNVRPIRSAANWLHVDGVIQSDYAKIAPPDASNGTQRGEFRVAVREVSDVRCEPPRVAAGLQIGVTFGASLIAGSDNVDAPAVFGVARRARGSCYLCCVVNGPVMAAQASGVGSLSGKCAGSLQMPRRAFSFEHGVRCAHAARRIDAIISGKSSPRDPEERDQWQQQAEQEFGALQRRRPLEIVEVDTLREFLRCTCSCHGS